MRITLRSPRARFVFRLINIACAIFVSSYILFDVLDLDGSNRPTHPVKGQVFIASNVAEIKPTSFSTILDHRKSMFDELPSYREALASFRIAKESRVSGLKASRRHGYRVALPRSSVTDLAA